MLRVWLHGTHTGDLRLHAGSRWEFRFAEGYLDMPDRPVLGRYFEDQNLRELGYDATQSYLPAFFQNYLPEVGSWLREELAARAGVDPRRNGPLLAALGDDLPGALVVHDVDDLAPSHDEQPVVDRKVSPSTALRFSLAGMQPKLSVAREGSRYTLPVTGKGGRWIAKFPDPTHARVPEHEAAMLTIARRVGIDVPEHECVPWRDIVNLPESMHFAENLALVVRRYDRTDEGARLHQEDFAQVFDRHPYNKYNDVGEQNGLDATFRGIGRVIAGVCGHDDFIEYVRRLVFMVLVGNHDAHLKNWSLLYRDPRRARLAPAYDLLSTVLYIPNDGLALRFFKRRVFSEVLRSDFERLAEKVDVEVSRTLTAVDETVARFHDAWRADASQLPFSEAQRATLARHLAKLALTRGAQ